MSRMRTFIASISTGFLLMISHLSMGQEVVVRGGFLADSISIGEPVAYYLSVRYPSETDIYLPDSLYRFQDFGYVSRVWFPTRTTDGRSYDSAVYHVVSFSIADAQALAAPAWTIAGTDTLFHFPEPDTVLLRQFVTFRTDTIAAAELPLISNTDYQDVWQAFNYPALMLASGILILTGIVIWILFGKRIRRYFRRRKILKRMKAFQQEFGKHLQELQTEFRPHVADEAIRCWKSYLEELEGRPYRSLTSREIGQLSEHRELSSVLSSIDRMIYGRVRPDSMDGFRRLQAFGEDRSHLMLDKIERGQA